MLLNGLDTLSNSLVPKKKVNYIKDGLTIKCRGRNYMSIT